MSIKDAERNAQLAITIVDMSPLAADKITHIPFGGTTITLFDEDGKLKMGRQKCKVYLHKDADGSAATSTPSVLPPKRRKPNTRDPSQQSPEEAELERVEILIKKHEMGEIPRVDWMDQLLFRELEKLKTNADEAAQKRALELDAALQKDPKHFKDQDDSSDEEDIEDEYFDLLR